MDITVVLALLATLFTWGITALGAATVLFFKRTERHLLNPLLGFAAGVMIAASFWSLLQPAIEQAERFSRFPAYLTVTIGFLCGAAFLWLSDKLICRMRGELLPRGNRTLMLLLSITLHNVPEGLAVGVAFGALRGNPDPWEGLLGAAAIAFGIALQNFPEGAAVALPLLREGYSRKKSFFWGQASGIVEPIAGVLGALAVTHIQALLPLALSFAAGSMILVAVHELIPECQTERDTRPYSATAGIILGFAFMMLLDVALG